MKTARATRILALSLTLAMILSMMLVFTVSGSAEGSNNLYELSADNLTPFPAGAKYDGEYEKAGTNNYFTIFYSSKAKLEDNDKSFDDGLMFTRRFSWGNKTEFGDTITNAIKIKTAGSATVKLWWVCGGEITDTTDIRQVAIFAPDGSVVAQTDISDAKYTPKGDDGFKNDQFISELKIPAAGVYYIGNVGGSNYFHQIAVTDSADGPAPSARADWASVSAPVISSATDNGEGGISVKVNALIGHDGADELIVRMYDKDGNEVQSRGSVTENSAHTLLFTPANSGSYSFKAELSRAENANQVKHSSESSATFVYPLAAPNISSATSIGGGAVRVKWGAVHEAEKYNIYMDGDLLETVDGSVYSHTVTGLTVGQEYSFVVSAVRGNQELKSTEKKAKATAEAMREWTFAAYGPSASESKNKYSISTDENGGEVITISSQGNAGKIQPAKHDGLAFYYTAIPTSENFTLRAKVKVDTWTYSNAQEGFGLMVTDRVGVHGDTSDVWNNSYLGGATKIEYKFYDDGEEGEIVDVKVVDDSLRKFEMRLGIGAISRTGATPENLYLLEGKGNPALGEMSSTEAYNKYFVARTYTLDRTAADISNIGGKYNVIGNCTNTPDGSTFEERFLITEFVIEIQRNNTGYFITHYDLDGNMIMQKKFYDTEALSHLDEEYVYAGFFAARNVTASFSDITLETIPKDEDKSPVETPPTTYITPTVTVNSGTVTTNDDYELIVDANVAGSLTVKYLDKVIAENVVLEIQQRFRTNIDLKSYNVNTIKIEFTPDPDQDLGEHIELSHTRMINLDFEVKYNRGNYHRKTVYISPDVLPYTTTADGTRENPFDIFTALENAYPGQTLILMEGTYTPHAALKVQRGMDGTADAMIRLIADPEAKTRPVIDFEGLYAGFTHAGDYWYFRGFDITGSQDMQKGFQISGNYNILDQINTYENGNSGIQISRLSGSDLMPDWPSYNLVLNCTSYRNYDSGFEDADGFAAKLTIGPGNVFDGCIAYNNADDGWDLYAKVETGPIGAVTIRNCISYENGFVPGAGSKTGNGNGFKMGGESLSGKHVLENCIAFNNLMKGLDSNSCPDIIIKNCVSFNNGGHNVALYTNNTDNTAFVANGIVSFRTEDLDVKESLEGRGTQIKENYINETNYYWNSAAEKSMNSLGEQITADMFVSLTFNGWDRNADGTINLKGFLEINDKAPANAKDSKLGGTASYTVTLEEDEECTFGKSWFNLDKDAHWHVCECGNKTEVTEHNFIWIIDKKVNGDEPGLKHQQCTVCKYQRAAITIYPEGPATPDDDVDTPDTGDDEELSFFARIWQAILNFFRRIFGIEIEAALPAKHRVFYVLKDRML